ncbi:hypothetical protein [Shewanella psychrotolerans]|uniref:hypothetical protein n=1 Tax=Shewanella psychrotolerans TaxID=2864206 RepID=UPI001C65686A|nr:hypothetical protein [Shewanella psychrotolerans]QYK01203.1 hypothetical protein K0I62_17835 [Shewanella psychrotolerans]
MEENLVKQEGCYLSTLEHMQSFIGRWFYIYTDRGVLTLTSASLTFKSDKQVYAIPLDAISNIDLGNYPRTAKPFPLKYIKVTYSEGGENHTVILTPNKSWVSSVWKTNKAVDDWLSLLTSSVSQVTQKTHA